MREGTPATLEIADDDRDTAVEIAQRLGVASAPLPSVDRVARLLAELRAAAYAAGLEAAADEAHASGYREGVEAVFTALPPDLFRLVTADDARRLEQLKLEGLA
jgi:hypothetical protein